MNKRDFLIVLPKLSAYANKDVDVQLYYDKIVSLWTNRILANDYNLCIIHEDILASKLIKTEHLKRYSMLKESSRNSYSRIEGISEEYLKIKKLYIDDNAINAGVCKVKIRPEDVIAGKEYLYLQTAAQLRVKFASEYLIDTAPRVIYIDAANNFCRKPVYSIGDGRLVCIVDVKTDVTNCFYGGVSVGEDIVVQIMEAKNGNI